MGIRVTEEEEERLEQLRGDLRLTSKGQVIRAALDLLEQVALAADALPPVGNSAETRRIMRRARRSVGVPRRADLDAAPSDDAIARNPNLVTSYKHVRGGELLEAESGSPAPDPAGPTAPAEDDSQLELPEMPARRPIQ